MARTRDTSLKRYGVSNIWKSSEFKKSRGTRDFSNIPALFAELRGYLDYYKIVDARIEGDTKSTSILYGNISGSDEFFSMLTAQALQGSTPFQDKRKFQEDVIHEAMLSSVDAEIRREHSISVYDEVIGKCRNLRIDFYLPELKLAIEYNGNHHYSHKWGGRSGIRETEHRDNIKYQYCVDMGIRIVVIPWYEVYDRDRLTFINNAKKIIKEVINGAN